MPLLALEVQRGEMPGQPGAKRVGESLIENFPSENRDLERPQLQDYQTHDNILTTAKLIHYQLRTKDLHQSYILQSNCAGRRETAIYNRAAASDTVGYD
jgi:hypothetical protein